MLTLLNGVGASTRHSTLSPVTPARAIASNGNLFPYTTVTSSNYVRNFRKMRVAPNNASYTDLKLTYTNFMVVTGAETISGLTDITVRAGIEYNGRHSNPGPDSGRYSV